MSHEPHAPRAFQSDLTQQMPPAPAIDSAELRTLRSQIASQDAELAAATQAAERIGSGVTFFVAPTALEAIEEAATARNSSNGRSRTNVLLMNRV
jgi:hypothetical protein